MCNHDYGLEKFFTGNFEQSQHILACSRIKISGRLIREQKGRLCRKRTGDGDALLLSAGECVRQAGELLVQTEYFHNFLEIVPVRRLSVQFYRKNNVFPDIQHGNKIVHLKYKADVAAAENGELLVGHGAEFLSVNENLAGGGNVQTANHMQKRGFSAAGGADNCRKFPLFYSQVYIFQSVDSRVAASVNFGKLCCF